MIENTKCECGHQNYVGTVLCESCGKPLQDLGPNIPLEMRYDGVLRRSQRKSRSMIDHVWRFFSSVKVAVYLIIITLLVAILGTIYPQENTFINLDPAQYYAENHGKLGEIYYMLGLSRTYESWWFLGLLFMIGTSLVVCSLDRVLPLYRALSRQQVRKHDLFLSRQKVVYSDTIFPQDAQEGKSADDVQNVKQQTEAWLQEIAKHLKKRFYHVRVQDGALMAEKHRFSRWGPYINHIGLIIFLLAGLLRTLIPGWYLDDYVSVMEGETVPLFDTGYYLKNEQFTVEFYPEEEMSESMREEGRLVPKLFETKVTLYRCIENCDAHTTTDEPVLEPVLEHDIQVNKPMNYKGLMAYQFDYDFTPQIRSVNARLKDANGVDYGEFLLDMNDPAPEYEVGPYQIELIRYYPEFAYEEGRPVTKSSQPRAPAFVFLIKGPQLEEGAVHMYFPNPIDKERFSQDDINRVAGSPFIIETDGMDDVDFALYTSFLNIRIDRGMPFIWVGAAICMIGLIMGSYWQHRRIWLRFDGGHLLLGAHTNKNWYGLRHEVANALAQMGIQVDPKSLSNEVT